MRQAFTLIELLVVISIIAILAAMLLPAVSMVRDAARSVACKNHVRQLGMAAISYIGDNEGVVPGYCWDNDFHWTVGLAQYIDAEWRWRDPSNNKQVRLYRCPADGPTDNSPYLPDSWWWAPNGGYYVTYGINQMTSHPTWNHWDEYNYTVLPAARIRSKARFFLFSDLNTAAWGQSINTDWTTMTSFRHRKSCNIVYLDGHVDTATTSNFGTIFGDGMGQVHP